MVATIASGAASRSFAEDDVVRCLFRRMLVLVVLAISLVAVGPDRVPFWKALTDRRQTVTSELTTDWERPAIC